MTAKAASIAVANEVLPLDAAHTACLGYCLGRSPLVWAPPPAAVGDIQLSPTVGAFAFEVYDAVAPAPGTSLAPLDILVANGLNAQMRASDIAAAWAVREAVSAELALCSRRPAAFWELSRSEIEAPGEDPSSVGHAMWRAWSELMGVPGVDLARAHKILHHKMPQLFPLIDNKTVVELRAGEAWLTVYDDLVAAGESWAALERRVGDALGQRGFPAVTRLRLHDILLWTRVTGNRARAEQLGQEVLAQDAMSSGDSGDLTTGEG